MQILHNLVQMTCQRDHLRLEVSVLSTFLQLPSITQVRALELGRVQGEIYVRARTWQQDQQLVSATADLPNDPQRQPLSSLPHLQSCIEQHQSFTQFSYAPNHHVLWLPVWMHEQVQVCLEITQAKPFTPHAMDVLMAIFNVYRNYQSLLDYSERDALTDLLNRKTFDEHLLRLASTAQAEHTELPWLAVLDIDHFKQVNDRFGHLFGDEVLILVANLLRTSFGPQHRIFRFGGEEFVVLLPPMTQADALQSLEDFRQRVESYEFPQVGRVTVSIGLAGAKLCSPVEILGQADQALYYAKEHGRNRVCEYATLMAQGLLGQRQISHDDVELF